MAVIILAFGGDIDRNRIVCQMHYVCQVKLGCIVLFLLGFLLGLFYFAFCSGVTVVLCGF